MRKEEEVKSLATPKIEEVEAMLEIPAYGAAFAQAPLAPLFIERREPGPHDLLINILYCGVCHSDIHQARGESGASVFPIVPGHEIVGTVVRRATRLRNGRSATPLVSVVSSILGANMKLARPAKNNSACGA